MVSCCRFYIWVYYSKNDYNIVASHNFPWLFGSAFEFHVVTQSCLKLKTSSGKWIRNDNGVISADRNSIDDADCLILESNPTNNLQFGIRIDADVSEFVSLSPNKVYVDGIVETTIVTTLVHRDMALFTAELVAPLRGINLGGWFIPEYWMQVTIELIIRILFIMLTINN